MNRLLRRALPAALAATALLLSGCTAPRPSVTFFGDRAAVNVDPELWCEVDMSALTVACPPSPDAGNDGHLTIGPDRSVQIDVPSAIGDTPWLVVFEYRDAAGRAQNGRSEVFTDDRLTYRLPGLGTGSQLTRVEVQSGLVPTETADGSTAITASRTWALVVAPRAPSTQTKP